MFTNYELCIARGWSFVWVHVNDNQSNTDVTKWIVSPSIRNVLKFSEVVCKQNMKKIFG